MTPVQTPDAGPAPAGPALDPNPDAGPAPAGPTLDPNPDAGPSTQAGAAPDSPPAPDPGSGQSEKGKSGGSGPCSSATGRAPAVFTAVNAASARPVAVAPHGQDGGPGRGDLAKGRVVVAAVAGAALAGGLAFLLVPGGAGGPTTIAITAHHSRFEPDRVTVKPNSTVRIVVHNSDPIDHEFIIGPPAVHELHERGTPHFHTGVTPGEITVPAGATVETSWTFGPSGSPAVAYGCHLAGHWAYGMHGLATIG